MDAASEKDITIAGQQALIPSSRRKLTGALWLVLGVGIMTAFLVGLQTSAAQAAGKGQAPGAPGAPGIPTICPVWYTVPSPNPGTDDSGLNSVAALSADDVWAVGTHGNSNSPVRTLTEHWNGSSWSVVPSPNPGTYDRELYGVAAISAGNVWAVGARGYQTLVIHWNGSVWSVVPSPNPSAWGNVLYGVAAVSADSVWAVGTYGSGPFGTVIEHWNGNTWSVVPSPNPGPTGTSYDLSGVAAVSANDVWAVGDYDNISGTFRTLTEHWNGNTWSIVSSPNQGSSHNRLSGVAAVSANDVWAVGDFTVSGKLRTLTEHWNGNTWSVVPSPNPGTSHDNTLNSVAAVSGNNVWAVGQGYYNGIDVEYSLTEHWNGSAWLIDYSPNPSTSENELYGIAALSASNLWAVGDYLNTEENWRTLVEHYGCPPPPTHTPTPTHTPIPTNTPVPFPTQCAINFADVPNPSTFYPFVQCLACRHIVSGFACGGPNEPCDPNNDPYFRPHDDVTRGQLAKIVALSARINTSVSGQSYQDVPPGSTFYTYTEQLHALGAMGGYACGGTNYPCIPPLNLPYFRPHNNATRGQLAKIDSNTAGYNDTATGQQFEDVAVGSTFYTYTYRLATRSIMSGYACGGTNEPCVPPANLPYFRPTNNVSRGQTSKIVANTFYPNCQAPNGLKR